MLAARDHRLHLAHHRIGRVAIVHRADLAGGFGDAHDLFAFFDRHRHRLFAKHVKPGLQEGFGDLEMRGVWRRDGDQINPVVAPSFTVQHLLPVAIGAIRSKPKRLRVGSALCGVDLKPRQ